jgi:GNAT superfamily N-acetyltransferase
MIQLKTFNKKELEDFMVSGAYQQYDFLPITKHRAFSQIRNPKASDEDILLILAFFEDQLAGYVGCFPDQLMVDGKMIHYAWLSTLYVSPEFRKKRPAKILLKKVFEVYQGKIAITEFTKEAEALYMIMGVFEDVFPKKGKRYYFRTDAATIVPEKKPKTEKLKPLLQLMDIAANSLISLRNMVTEKPDFHYEILPRIDEESVDFIKQFSSVRDAESINIFIDHPWVLEGEKDPKYLFSSFAVSFQYFWIKIFDDNNTLTDCFLLQLREGYLKIPYLFSNSDLSKTVSFLHYFIVENKVKGFTSYQMHLNEAIRHSRSFPKIYEKDFKREYLFHKDLLNELPSDYNPQFQDGDGDCMMT